MASQLATLHGKFAELVPHSAHLAQFLREDTCGQAVRAWACGDWEAFVVADDIVLLGIP